MKIIAIAFLCLLPAPVFADFVSTAHTVLESPRGPFGPHQLQSAETRVDGDLNPDGYLFKSAFRTPEAQNLARNDDFYLGNLFTTNYYELTGEILFGDPDSNHPDRHLELVAKAKLANSRATVMVRNWVLEKYYVRVFPESNLAKVYGLRSISDYESERAYADYFFDVYLRGLSNEFQFVLAMLLVRDSSVYDAPSMAEARDLMSATYNRILLAWGADNPKTVRLFSLRNRIHNQMSKEAIGEIDRYLTEVPEYAAEGNTELPRVREILTEYYAVNGSKIVELARDLGLRDLQAAASALESTDKSSPEHAAHLLAVSQSVAQLKGALVRNSQFNYLRTKSLLLIAIATDYLSQEALEISHPTSDTVRIFLNCAYSEGFLIGDNWHYFTSEIDSASDAAQIKKVMNDIVEVGTDTFKEAIAPSLAKWISVEPRMENFVDSAVKSSSLNALSQFAARIP